MDYYDNVLLQFEWINRYKNIFQIMHYDIESNRHRDIWGTCPKLWMPNGQKLFCAFYKKNVYIKTSKLLK